MTPSESKSLAKNPEKLSLVSRFFSGLLLVTATFLFASAFMVTNYKGKFSTWTKPGLAPPRSSNSDPCKADCISHGSEALPRGFVSETADLEMSPLWGPVKNKKSNEAMSLLAITVGIKQKENVNKIVEKFLQHDFSVILFHYDGNVNGWDDLEWSQRVNHIASRNQTKWWFAKRYLHPNIVAPYDYIFVWDEDVEVENFHVDRYLSIIRKEGLEISQPAIDPNGSEIHHDITERRSSVEVHRRIEKKLLYGYINCESNSTSPPCTGWVEVMVPVFSRASWRCVWHMIQPDLVIGWGLDILMGYCAQGNRTQNVGIVDSEYLVHRGVPVLGVASEPQDANTVKSTNSKDTRKEFLEKALDESVAFRGRWSKAAEEDKCWSKAAEDDKSWTKATEDDKSWTDPFH